MLPQHSTVWSSAGRYILRLFGGPLGEHGYAGCMRLREVVRLGRRYGVGLSQVFPLFSGQPGSKKATLGCDTILIVDRCRGRAMSRCQNLNLDNEKTMEQ
jgi:hypothetical protein